jgi:hypothetical protein
LLERQCEQECKQNLHTRKGGAESFQQGAKSVIDVGFRQ